MMTMMMKASMNDNDGCDGDATATPRTSPRRDSRVTKRRERTPFASKS